MVPAKHPHDDRSNAATSVSAAPARAWGGTQSTDHVLSAGRVVKVEADAGKITIEHRPICACTWNP